MSNTAKRRPSPADCTHSHGLWSLWDMLDKYALRFAKALIALDNAKVVCLPIRIPEGEREPTNREIAIAVALALDSTREACVACGMAKVIPELDRIAILIGKDTFAPRLGISQAIVHLQSRLKDDLSEQHFFHVRNEHVALYGQAELFGPAVRRKFKDAAHDIQKSYRRILVTDGVRRQRFERAI
ncbi:MAG: hypothetical protein WA268_15830 [Xanthobacteraceae bacterium]